LTFPGYRGICAPHVAWLPREQPAPSRILNSVPSGAPGVIAAADFAVARLSQQVPTSRGVLTI
jgi:hypothetical protein